ncbi:MAG TPA: nuclease-related domain-containing protein [Acidimicrobiales bacterium]|nr:nuclease-related domain-containing protein [Acidimicrobiales bacterium]
MRIISLRRADVCCVCGKDLAAGDRAAWDPGPRTVTCTDCTETPTTFDRGTAGGSLQQTAARRKERHQQQQEAKVAADRAWREEIKTQRPVLGRLASAVTPRARVEPEPAHVRSWAQGVPGELRVGEVLDSVEGIAVLHDRKVRGGRANIDHIAVTPSGVWVIDTKRYPDKQVEFRDVGGWFRTDECLMVGGRDHTKLVDAMAWQVQAVTTAANGMLEDVSVRPMLCFVESTWGWFPKAFRVRGVAVCWPLALPEILTRPGDLDAERIDSLARRLATALPPA